MRMASEPGGISTILGTFYERDFGVQQLLWLATGQLRRLKWQPRTDGAGGADIEFEEKDGIVVHLQLKRQNAGKVKWTVAELRAQSIFDAAAAWLDRGSGYHFGIASSVAAEGLKDICDQLQYFDGSDLANLKAQMEGEDVRKKAWKDVFEAWGLTSDNPSHVEIVVARLRRLRLVLLSRSQDQRDSVTVLAELVFSGDPAATVKHLAAFLESRLGRDISASDVVAIWGNWGSP